MADDQKDEKELKLPRLFEQPPDAISFYSDLVQISNTGQEVLLQFYETIPGVPVPDGMAPVRSRLRATVMMSLAHADTLERTLRRQREQSGVVQEAQAAPAKEENL